MACTVYVHAAGQEVALDERVAEAVPVLGLERARLHDVNAQRAVVVVVAELQLQVAPLVRRPVILQRHTQATPVMS